MLALVARHECEDRAFAHPSVTGLDWSIPFFALSPSPSTRFCPGSARGRHLMGYEEDRPTNVRERARKPHWVGNGLTCPSSRRGDFASGRLVSRPAREPLIAPLSGRGGGRIEWCSVDQHAMHDHGELAGERDLGLVHADALGEPCSPALE